MTDQTVAGSINQRGVAGALGISPAVRRVLRELAARGLRVHAHREVPPNDGGVSFGQAAWALGRGG